MISTWFEASHTPIGPWPDKDFGLPEIQHPQLIYIFHVCMFWSASEQFSLTNQYACSILPEDTSVLFLLPLSPLHGHRKHNAQAEIAIAWDGVMKCPTKELRMNMHWVRKKGFILWIHKLVANGFLYYGLIMDSLCEKFVTPERRSYTTTLQFWIC